LAEGGGHLATRPGTVRQQEVEKAALLALEQALRALCEFEKLHSLVHVGLFGGLVPIDLALQARLLAAPRPGKAVMDTTADGVCYSCRAMDTRGSVPALALLFGGIAIALGGVVSATAIAAAMATR